MAQVRFAEVGPVQLHVLHSCSREYCLGEIAPAEVEWAIGGAVEPPVCELCPVQVHARQPGSGKTMFLRVEAEAQLRLTGHGEVGSAPRLQGGEQSRVLGMSLKEFAEKAHGLAIR